MLPYYLSRTINLEGFGEKNDANDCPVFVKIDGSVELRGLLCPRYRGQLALFVVEHVDVKD